MRPRLIQIPPRMRLPHPTTLRRTHSTLHPAIVGDIHPSFKFALLIKIRSKKAHKNPAPSQQPASPTWSLSKTRTPSSSSSSSPSPPTPLTAAHITHLARLAGLSLAEPAIPTHVADINALCALVEPIRDVDTRGVETLVSLLRDVNAGTSMREDVYTGGEEGEVRSRALLKCAQRVDGPYYIVEKA
ncbi:hypothetical protein BDZ88DRAFT_36220 [Geranomyces variabilis]|nr:hypothetical protein BDZ88DRAFT_36220 [Geranomyces variabilis]